ADDVAFGIEREGAGRNVFKDGFDQLAAALEFADGILEVVGELIDLEAGVTQLCGHAIEGADEVAQFVVGLFGDLVVEIARGDFASAFGQGLDGPGDLLGEIKSKPEYRGEKQYGEKGEDEQELALQGAEVLLFLVVG